ncbi:VanZ like family protein [Kordia sp. SMS9]|uniref:VanZ family protein n=1 Tax=Kordia sp. SMS9 TaxID=2282170 RepID=UPI000E0D35BC|nr:VanZ family protein [Kordia sp. SMS9]AXG69504.1 VanZ like family protein [Kordia sp. SMS9]
MRKYIFSVVAIVWTIAITVLSLIQIKGPQAFHFSYADKVMHIIIYCSLTLTWFFAFSRGITNEFLQKNALMASAVVCFIYGIAVEVMQETLVTTRQGDWQDALANTIGIILAIFIIKWFIAKYIKLKTHN